MKKNLPFILFFITTALIIWKLEPKNVKVVEIEKPVSKREIASIPSSKKEVLEAKKSVKVEVLEKKKAPQNQIIENKLLGHYHKLFDKEVKVSLEYEKDVMIHEDKASYKAKIYKISFDKGKGNKSNFNAMVDAKTGAILKTWNHTRYEFKTPVRLSGQGQEFYSL